MVEPSKVGSRPGRTFRALGSTHRRMLASAAFEGAAIGVKMSPAAVRISSELVETEQTAPATR